AQAEEQLAGDEVDQAVFQRPGREAYPAVTAQACLTEDVTFPKTVEQLAIGPVDLHRATADVVQLADLDALLENRRACLEVAHRGLTRDRIQGLCGGLVTGRGWDGGVAGRGPFVLHGPLPARTLPSVYCLCAGRARRAALSPGGDRAGRISCRSRG